MLSKSALKFTLGVALLAGLHGCNENDAAPRPTPPPLSSEPIGIQVTRADPRLAGNPFRVLLDFERATDAPFVLPQSANPHPSPDRAHTGRAALRVDQGGSFAVKASSLVGGAFPGSWTIAGAYFCAPAGATVTVACADAAGSAPRARRTVELRPGPAWAPVFLDLTPDPATGATAAPSLDTALLTFRVEAVGPVYCDDVIVINNARTLEAPPAGASPRAGWTIRQAGFATVVERPERFRVALKSPDASADGWKLQESSDLRARFTSASGKTWTIYADGRQYQNGQFSPLGPVDAAAAAQFARQHASPAELTVPEEFGRVDRDTPGDRNNDGYNEHRGAYQLLAKGSRFEVVVKPTTPLLSRPVLEIAGLPAGAALVTAEGQLIERSTRLASGTLLVELPLALERATTVNVSVK